MSRHRLDYLYPPGDLRKEYYYLDEMIPIGAYKVKPVTNHHIREDVVKDILREQTKGMLSHGWRWDGMRQGYGQFFPNCCVRCRTPHSADGYYELKNSFIGICKLHKGSGGAKIHWYKFKDNAISIPS